MKSKVTRVIELWHSKSYITANDVARINEFITAVDVSSFGEANNADAKVLASPYLQKECIAVNNSNPISTSNSSTSSTSSSSSINSSSMNAPSNSDSGGQTQEQLSKLQQIQQIQEQIQQHIAKLNQQQQPPQVQQPSHPSQQQQQQQQSDLVKQPREKLSAEQPVHVQPVFNPPPPENPPDSIWTSSFSGTQNPGNMNMSMMMPTPGPYPNPTMLSYPQQQQQQQQQQHAMGTFFPPPFTPQGPPPPPPSNPLTLPPSLMLDLTRMPVGQMSHLIKTGLYVLFFKFFFLSISTY